MVRPESGYFASKAKRKNVKVKTSDYSLQSHIDEAVILSNEGASGAVQFNLLPAIPGRKVVGLIEAAEELRLHPDGNDQVSTSAGVLLAAGKYVESSVVGERIELVCEETGKYVCKSAVGTWASE